MVRCVREKSVGGIYYIMMRGINRQDIFYADEDYRRFLETMKRVKESRSCALYEYCLMGNHVDLLLHEEAEGLSNFSLSSIIFVLLKSKVELLRQ